MSTLPSTEAGLGLLSSAQLRANHVPQTATTGAGRLGEIGKEAAYMAPPQTAAVSQPATAGMSSSNRLVGELGNAPAQRGSLRLYLPLW